MNLRHLTATLFSILLISFGTSALAQPAFTKTFSPDTVGPGNTSMLTLTIDNTGSATPVSSLAFTDPFPAGMSIADNTASFTCPAGTLTATAGATSVSFADGTLGAGNICTISLKVLAPSTPAAYTNTTGALTSSAGNSGTATDDLTVVTTLPSFAKGFAPSSVSLGGTSTLTYTIDNSANAAAVGSVDFTEVLPTGMKIATPSVTATDCISPINDTTLTATAGGSTITLDADGYPFSSFEVLSAGATCTVTVDVIATGAGMLTATSGELLADSVAAGASSATLEVTAAQLNIAKQFLDDPVGAGGTTTLEFTLDNFTRGFAASGVGFVDDLTSTGIAGLTYSSLLSNTCDGTVGGTGTTSINFSGGNIAAEGSCTIQVRVTVPGATAPGAYTNTTSEISGTIDGSTISGNLASDSFQVLAGAPLTFSQLFVGGAVDAGNPVTLRYTIGNPNTGASLGATDITFDDELTDPSGGFGGAPAGTGFLPFPVSVTLPGANPCGAGSTVTLQSAGNDRQKIVLSNGALLASETSCTFDVIVTIPGSLPGGSYSNTTGPLTATIGAATAPTPGASASLVVNDGLKVSLSKSFASAAAPGATVDLTFTLSNTSDSVIAENLTFTDNLSAMLAGATAGAPTADTCGGTMTGTTTLSYSLASLPVSTNCLITVPVTVPASATPGTYPNNTSQLSATTGGSAPVLFPLASADLVVAGLKFTKEFLTTPVIAGATTILRFTIENQSPTEDATSIGFTDNLNGALTGLAATTDGATIVDTCGGTMIGTTFLVYFGGSVTAGASCTIEVELLVPAASADGSLSLCFVAERVLTGGIPWDPWWRTPQRSVGPVCQTH